MIWFGLISMLVFGFVIGYYFSVRNYIKGRREMKQFYQGELRKILNETSKKPSLYSGYEVAKKVFPLAYNTRELDDKCRQK